MRMTPARRAVLFAVLALALALRAFALEDIPNGLQIDEASIAFTAYVVGETGRDETGRAWPLYPQSSWNPKHPVYFYPAVACVKAFGLNKFSARLPAALFGVLGVLAAFLLGRELFRSADRGLAAALLLALSPWHTHFSRFGIEAVSLPAVFSLGLLLLLQGVRGRPARLLPGALLMGLTFYAYPVALLFTPLFLMGFAALFRGELLKTGGWAAAAAVLVAALWLPCALGSFKATKMDTYFRAQSITGQAAQERIKTHLSSKDSAAARAASGSRAARTAYAFATNYAGYLSPAFLLTKGDSHSETHGPRGYGVMHLASFALLLAGVIFMAAERRREHLLLAWWLLAFPAGAALMTWGEQHAIRAITALPALQLIAAFALLYSRPAPGNPHAARAALFKMALVLAILFVNAAGFFHFYFTDYRTESAASFHRASEQAFAFMKENKGDYASCAAGWNPYAYALILFHDPPPAERIARDPRTGALDAARTLRAMGYTLCPDRACLESLPLPALVMAPASAFAPGAYRDSRDRTLYVTETQSFKTPGTRDGVTLFRITGAMDHSPGVRPRPDSLSF